MIRRLGNGLFRLVSRKKEANGNRRNLGTFSSRAAALRREAQVEYFKNKGK